MSKSKSAAATEAAASEPTTSPLVTSLLALAGAVVAVARFPNWPVPQAMVDRISEAQQSVIAAARATTSVAGEPVTYDDAWIRSALDGLNERLSERFSAIDDATAKLNERFESMERSMSEQGEKIALISADSQG